MGWTWIVTVLSLVGTVANVKRRSWCFIIWLGTNITWCVVDIRYGLYSQAFLYAIYTGLALWGLHEWRNKR